MYEFTNDCLLNIDTIDDEHRHLFKLINDAFALVKETDDVAPVAKNLLSSLKDYANTHFAHEEAYMESINDPELSLQKKEHAAFSAKINSFIRTHWNFIHDHCSLLMKKFVLRTIKI